MKKSKDPFDLSELKKLQKGEKIFHNTAKFLLFLIIVVGICFLLFVAYNLFNRKFGRYFGYTIGWSIFHNPSASIRYESADIDGKYDELIGGDDYDFDGLNNQEERNLGTNVYNIDSDLDGYSDKLEVIYQSDPLLFNKKDLDDQYPNLVYQDCNKKSGVDKDNCYLYLAEKERVKTYCDYIENKNLQKSCYNNLAFFNKDRSICDYFVEGSNDREICTLNFLIANGQYKSCEDLKYTITEAVCTIEIAQYIGMPELCSTLYNPDVRESCYVSFGGNKYNGAYCNLIGNKTSESECYKQNAIEKNDINYCIKARDKDIREECFDEFNKNPDLREGKGKWVGGSKNRYSENDDFQMKLNLYLLIPLIIFFVLLVIRIEKYAHLEKNILGNKTEIVKVSIYVSVTGVCLFIIVFNLFSVMGTPKYTKSETYVNEIEFYELINRDAGDYKDTFIKMAEYLKKYPRYYELVVNNIKKISFHEKIPGGKSNASMAAGSGGELFVRRSPNGKKATNIDISGFASVVIHEANHLEYFKRNKWRARFLNIQCSPFLNTNISVMTTGLDADHKYETVEICAEREQLKFANLAHIEEYQLKKHGVIYYFFLNLKNLIFEKGD